jgi:hypothetical protein
MSHGWAGGGQCTLPFLPKVEEPSSRMIRSWWWSKLHENCLEFSCNVTISIKAAKRVWRDNLRHKFISECLKECCFLMCYFLLCTYSLSVSWVWKASADLCWSRCEKVHALNCKLIQCEMQAEDSAVMVWWNEWKGKNWHRVHRRLLMVRQ